MGVNYIHMVLKLNKDSVSASSMRHHARVLPKYLYVYSYPTDYFTPWQKHHNHYLIYNLKVPVWSVSAVCSFIGELGPLWLWLIMRIQSVTRCHCLYFQTWHSPHVQMCPWWRWTVCVVIYLETDLVHSESCFLWFFNTISWHLVFLNWLFNNFMS